MDIERTWGDLHVSDSQRNADAELPIRMIFIEFNKIRFHRWEQMEQTWLMTGINIFCEDNTLLDYILDTINYFRSHLQKLRFDTIQ